MAKIIMFAVHTNEERTTMKHKQKGEVHTIVLVMVVMMLVMLAVGWMSKG